VSTIAETGPTQIRPQPRRGIQGQGNADHSAREQLRAADKRDERRSAQKLLSFPERRFADRRGRQNRAVA